MNKKSEFKGPSPVAGISSLLVLFLVLCLVVFACLTLATAKSDYSFSVKNAENRSAYVQACNDAEATIAELCDKGYSGTESWSVDIDSNRSLDVEVSFNGNGRYKINKWQTVNTGSDDNGGTLQLMQLN